MAQYDDSTEEIQLDPEPGAEPEEETKDAIVYDEDALNLVPDFVKSEEGKRYLQKISTKVDADYTADWDSSEAYRERQAADWKLFAGDLPEKDFPFEDAANPHLPLMLENLSRLCFRATGELFGDWTTVFGVVPVGPDDDQVAEMLSKHGNWQISQQITDFKRQIGHRGVLAFFAYGDVVCHSFYDEESRTNRHEILTCDNFVTPFQHISTKPDLSDCPHYTKVLRLYRHELEAKRGIWHDVDKVLEKSRPSWDDDPDAPLTEATAQTLGKTPEGDHDDMELGGETAPFTLLWYEGWLRLPNQDKDRWCQVIQDKATKCILRLTIHERANWQDRERYNAQLRERDEHIQALGMHGQMMAEYEQMTGLHREAQSRIDQTRGEIGDALIQGQMDGENAVRLADTVEGMAPPPPPPPPPPPMPPEWMESRMVPKFDELTGEEVMPDIATVEPEPIRREPVFLFAHEVCIEPMTGNLGISYGRVQADFNRAANIALAQVTDSATLNNATSYLSWGLEFEDGTLNLSPGKVNKVNGAIGTNIKDHFMPLQTGQASPQLFDVVKLSIDQAQASIQSPGVLSGESGKSGETKGGIMSRIEQATKQLSVVTSKYGDFVRQVLINNAYLNSIFLRDEEMAQVFNTETKRFEELKLGRLLYERNYRVMLKSDLRFTTNVQRIEEADELVKMWLQIPALAINPVFGYHAIKGALVARGKQDFIQYLGQPPQMAVDQMTGEPVKFIGMPPPPPPPGGPPGAPQGPPKQLPAGPQ
jgi:hypothetical protein